jgi:hypothetical protein
VSETKPLIDRLIFSLSAFFSDDNASHTKNGGFPRAPRFGLASGEKIDFIQQSAIGNRFRSVAQLLLATKNSFVIVSNVVTPKSAWQNLGPNVPTWVEYPPKDDHITGILLAPNDTTHHIDAIIVIDTSATSQPALCSGVADKGILVFGRPLSSTLLPKGPSSTFVIASGLTYVGRQWDTSALAVHHLIKPEPEARFIVNEYSLTQIGGKCDHGLQQASDRFWRPTPAGYLAVRLMLDEAAQNFAGAVRLANSGSRIVQRRNASPHSGSSYVIGTDL